MLVATSLPANAFYNPEAAALISASSSEVTDATAAPQSVVIEEGAAADAAPLERDGYTAETQAQKITSMRVANSNFSYTNNPNGSVQWPFPAAVPISSGFGGRAVCSYCSSYHLGVDFTPGAGTPIQSIAAGVVSSVVVGNGGYGNNVVIDHVINGQRVQSLYAHMAWGSIQVAVGQQVSVGTIVGQVGSTGNSTGAHLHLEVHLDGTPVDPFAWLKANAN